MYGDRINELDIRVAKLLRYGRSRLMVAVDMYNVLNSSAVLSYNTRSSRRHLAATAQHPHAAVPQSDRAGRLLTCA
jgi:hypothetical protein